jgi:hypothetical protein
MRSGNICVSLSIIILLLWQTALDGADCGLAVAGDVEAGLQLPHHRQVPQWARLNRDDEIELRQCGLCKQRGRSIVDSLLNVENGSKRVR